MNRMSRYSWVKVSLELKAFLREDRVMIVAARKIMLLITYGVCEGLTNFARWSQKLLENQNKWRHPISWSYYVHNKISEIDTWNSLCPVGSGEFQLDYSWGISDWITVGESFLGLEILLEGTCHHITQPIIKGHWNDPLHYIRSNVATSKHPWPRLQTEVSNVLRVFTLQVSCN